ncbi:hypothetical protein [Nocardioides pakistanensis]
MPATKIQDEAEVRRWFEEGRTYAWMVEEYERKYGLVVVKSMFGNFRRRRGLERRITRDDDLIPWHVNPEHRHDYDVLNLRAEARIRSGREVSQQMRTQVAAWKRRLLESGMVIDYDPVEGFRRVASRPNIDGDLIRRPDRKTSPRLAAD